jgi:hypothetical protein
MPPRVPACQPPQPPCPGTHAPRLKESRDELLQLLLSGDMAGSAGRRIGDLVDLLSASALPFKESQLGGGPWVVRANSRSCRGACNGREGGRKGWLTAAPCTAAVGASAGTLPESPPPRPSPLTIPAQLGPPPPPPRPAPGVAGTSPPSSSPTSIPGAMQVRYTRGPPLLWSATYAAGKLVSSSNQASQEFDPRRRTAVNRAEYWGGGAVYVTASGTYEPQVTRVSPVRLCLRCSQAGAGACCLCAWHRAQGLPWW